MSAVDFLLQRFQAQPEADALFWQGKKISYRDFLALIEDCGEQISSAAIPEGQIVSIRSDFSPRALAWFLALARHNCILVPGNGDTDVAEVEATVEIAADDTFTVKKTGRLAQHSLLMELRSRRQPGLVLFSSGSSGPPKAGLHDLSIFLEKFHRQRPARRMISFLLFDHIGGLNTALACFASLGCLVIPSFRTPEGVADAIEKGQAEALPTSPTFLNLFLLSRAWEQRDLSSLRLITYGTEPMLASTLERLRQIFPQVDLQQTYGLSEIGILRSKSRSPDSLWMKIGGEKTSLRVVDGLLEIKTPSTILGYLNATAPMSADGWYQTGDEVETDGEWIRILGRRSDMINVGGLKVSPSKVASVISEIDNVEEVVIAGEANALTGNIVTATVKLQKSEDPAAFRERVREYCRSRLAPYETPQRITISAEALHSARFKTRLPSN